MIERPLTVNETAEYLHVHPWTVRSYIKKGLLTAHKIGERTEGALLDVRRMLIWPQDLRDFVNRNQTEGQKSDA